MTKNTRKIYIAALLLLAAFTGKAQQDPMFSMYMFDKLLINPAFTGSSNWAVGTLKHRDQFTAMNGRPRTQTFNFHMPLQKQHLGIGLKVIQDKIALMNNLNAALLLSYHLNFGGGKLSLGIEGGVFQKRIDYQQLVLSVPGDRVIPQTATTIVKPDASMGIYYQKKQFYSGFSAYHLIDQAFAGSGNTGDADTRSHYYFLAGNVFALGERWSLEPSLLLKYQANRSLQADINTMLYFNDRIGLGGQYRTGDAVAGVLRINITEGLRLAYAYDYTISRFAPFSKGSHEIILSYGIRLLPPAIQKEIHPRYYF